ncbi:MAG: WYL domain-containing protein, partial [Planctomycetota bacterium]
QMLDEPAIIPDDFNLKAYFGNAWSVYRGEQSHHVELLFSKAAAEVVTETVWHHTQKIQRHADGTVTMTFTVDGLNEIVRWVLGWAGRVQVIQPQELRQLVLDQHRQAIQINEDDKL